MRVHVFTACGQMCTCTCGFYDGRVMVRGCVKCAYVCAAPARTLHAHSHGHLHEIHLTDPRRVSPDRWRVILRLPIEAA